MIHQFEAYPHKTSFKNSPFPSTNLRVRKHWSVTNQPTMMSAHGLVISLIFVSILANEASFVHEANGSFPMVPLMEAGKMEMMMVMNESRRKLGSFQICALCTCCGGAKGVCLPSPCCYAINCNIPNRPFGFCSFTPKTCNCFGCHL